ncbi:MAG: hypothetical protein ACK5EA_25220, partial [Planctomycetaceae bacterium]
MPDAAVPQTSAPPEWTIYRPLWRGMALAYLVWGVGLWLFPRPARWSWGYSGAGGVAQGRRVRGRGRGEAAALRVTRI